MHWALPTGLDLFGQPLHQGGSSSALLPHPKAWYGHWGWEGHEALVGVPGVTEVLGLEGPMGVGWQRQ